MNETTVLVKLTCLQKRKNFLIGALYHFFPPYHEFRYVSFLEFFLVKGTVIHTINTFAHNFIPTYKNHGYQYLYPCTCHRKNNQSENILTVLNPIIHYAPRVCRTDCVGHRLPSSRPYEFKAD